MIDHRLQFREFCALEQNAGGPDPHMKLALEHVNDEDPKAKWWMAGCYVGVYNYPTAEALFKHVPMRYLREDLGSLESWLADNWAGIATRRERRSVRTPRQLALFLWDFSHYPFANWMGSILPPEALYELLWADLQRSIYSLGRYSCLKLMEFSRRAGLFNAAMPDLRMKDGWSPRAGLALLYPMMAEELGRSSGHLVLAELLGDGARSLVAPTLSRFEAQVLLCDYKQAWNGRQYPGRSQDSELEYEAKVSPHWGASQMFEHREALFPRWALGEHNGWTGVRKELGKVLRDHGYTWSDSLFDYVATNDLASPVPR